MAKTAQLGLPLVAPAQAQKHVTVNEAFARLDAIVQLRVISSIISAPPAPSLDGDSYLVPDVNSGDWVGKAGQIAVYSNGGWLFVFAKRGWRAWDESRNGFQTFDGIQWRLDAVVVSRSGAATLEKIVELDHVVTPGTTNLVPGAIPAGSLVIGVTARVMSRIQGGLTSWRVGVPGAADRYGSGLGAAVDSYLIGLSGAPVSYYMDTPLLISGEGGGLLAGQVRICIHLLQITPPRFT